MCSCDFEFGFDDDPGASSQALPTVTENLERWRSNLVKRARDSEGKYEPLLAQLAIIGVRDV